MGAGESREGLLRLLTCALRGESRSFSRPDTQTVEFPRASPGISDFLSCDSPSLSQESKADRSEQRGGYLLWEETTFSLIYTRKAVLLFFKHYGNRWVGTASSLSWLPHSSVLTEGAGLGDLSPPWRGSRGMAVHPVSLDMTVSS